MPVDGVTVVVPVRDEASTVGAALESLAAQTIGAAALEVLVYDGASTDATAEICRSFADRAAWRRFEVLDNPQQTVPHALNDGLRRSTCRWFTRLDGRTRLSPNYLAECLTALEAAQRPTGVGGRFVAEADGVLAESIAAAVTHRLGVGRGFRSETRAVEVPHHPFAVWATADVVRFGGFDAELVRNQDDEFSMRAREGGARIELAPEGVVFYRPRERLRGLSAQYFQYGLWKSAVGIRHGRFPVRSVLPAGVVVTLAGAAGLAATGATRLPAAAMAGAYLAMGAVAAHSRRDAHPMVTALAIAAVHSAYGVGIIAGALRPGLAGGALGRARLK